MSTTQHAPIRSPQDPRFAAHSPSSSSSSASSSQPDVIVVGSGIVGSALAYGLGRSGRNVALVERDFDEPDRIVGELLQPGGVRALGLLGLADTLDGIDAVAVEGYQVFYGDRSVPIPYPDQKAEESDLGVSSSSGRVEGRSFHHGKFVQSLRSRALAQPNVTAYEATVRDLIHDPKQPGKVAGITATWKAPPAAAAAAAADTRDSPGSFELRAPLTIVVDGCFSKFRRTHGSSIAPTVRSNFVGLELEDAPLPAPHHGHVVLGKAGPVLLYQIGSHSTRILIDVQGEKLPSAAKGELQAHIRDKVIPQLPEQLRECVLKELDKGQRLRSMPNSFLPPSMQGQSDSAQGVVVVGDAMNMRHPLTGGGMSVGLWDAVHLTSLLSGGEWTPSPARTPARPVDLSDWSALRPALRQWHWYRKNLSSVINILAQALYSLFGADDANLEVLREGCFKYFELGGECVNGPVSLLSGLAPQPLLLVGHFFAVALYSIYTLFTHPRLDARSGKVARPSLLAWPGLVWRSIMVFYTACIVILPVIATELKSNIPSLPGVGGAKAAVGTRGKAKMVDGTEVGGSMLMSYATVVVTLAAVVLLYTRGGGASVLGSAGSSASSSGGASGVVGGGALRMFGSGGRKSFSL
ncbi:related to squalene monooxygenase [Pseudozyma flocculosa]|uniref:Squalene epoxidase ERG1 n=1 Tax=Pseudozyma flocculosa TaxID=84751 RepID=A0A5C3EXL8_9BASI|nr:related to squalene monooxygenase [Pseudozyma flocculosa]